MSVSIYYTASREEPLTSAEWTAIDAIVARYPVEALVAECEGFCVYDEGTEPGVVFQGATKLPFSDDDEAVLRYWCALLSEVRRVIEGATWKVQVDEAMVPWDEKLQRFFPGDRPRRRPHPW